MYSEPIVARTTLAEFVQNGGLGESMRYRVGAQVHARICYAL